MDCPRRRCGGQLLRDLSEANVLTCLLCSHSYMQLAGELIWLESRAPSKQERVEVRGKKV